jgi:hypothetical protein
MTQFALGQKKAVSPRDSVLGKSGNAAILITYGSPSVKGRVIWGDLVPYSKVWRTGANEATTFKTNNDILVEGKKLAKGTYGFFAIPGEKEWIIIFNKNSKQWGAYDYKQSEDVLRVAVKAKKSSSMHERLIYKINESGFSLLWENLEVPVSIK